MPFSEAIEDRPIAFGCEISQLAYFDKEIR
jgi:hypothetical protein